MEISQAEFYRKFAFDFHKVFSSSLQAFLELLLGYKNAHLVIFEPDILRECYQLLPRLDTVLLYRWYSIV